MSYMESEFVTDSAIQELSFGEISAVFGGYGVSTNLPPGTCPPGYVVQSATYNGSGDLVSIVCVPSQTGQKVRDVAETGNAIISVLNDAGEWISSWFS